MRVKANIHLTDSSETNSFKVLESLRRLDDDRTPPRRISVPDYRTI